MVKLMWLIKYSRFKKKLSIYKKLFLIVFDITLFTYIGLFMAYLGFIIIKENIEISDFTKFVPEMTSFSLYNGVSIAFVIMFIAVIRSFKQPALKWTTAEWKLITLPYQPKAIYKVLYIEKAIATALIVAIISTIYIVISNSAVSFVMLYVVLLYFIYIATFSYTWRLFQRSFMRKILALLIVVVSMTLATFVANNYVHFVFIAMAFLLDLLAKRDAMHNVDWERVRHTMDFKVWQLPLIGMATKQKFKKKSSKAAWYQKLLFQKPFNYQGLGMYHRLWLKYFIGEGNHIVKILFALMALNTALGFLETWVFAVSLGITIFVWVSFTNGIYYERFTYDVIEYLPWQFEKFRKSFQIWIYIITLLLVLPMIVRAAIIQSGSAIIISALGIIIIYVSINLELKNQEIKLINKQLK